MMTESKSDREDTFEQHDRGGGVMKKSIFILSIFIVFLSLSASYTDGREIRTVEGLIESVTGDSIKVRSRYYDFSGIPLEDASGKKMQKDQLKVGRKVEIFFESNRIKTILIYPEYMAE
jgi:hypothetical protein